MLIGGVAVAESDQTVDGAVAAFLHAVHGGNRQERVGNGDRVLNSGAVVCLDRGVVLVDVVLEQRHGLAEDHGIAGLAHDHTLGSLDTVVGHVAGLGHFLNGGQQVQHLGAGVLILQVGVESVVQAGADTEDVQEVRSGCAGVGENEAEGVVLGAVLDGFHELIVSPAALLHFGNIHTGGFQHILVGAQCLDGDVEGQAVDVVLDGHVVKGVLVKVSQLIFVHVLAQVQGGAVFDVGCQACVGDLGDVRGLAGLGHGGQLGGVVVPGGADDFHGQVGIHLVELVCPLGHLIQIVAGDGGHHNGDGVLGFRGRGFGGRGCRVRRGGGCCCAAGGCAAACCQ